MSALRFSIIDYTRIVSGLPTTTIIDEPVGLDKVTLHINRDKDYHGFSDMVDDSLGKLQFYNNAFSILSAAYQNVGIDARVECLIEFACDDDDTYQTLYQGRFKMDTFKSYEGIDGCYAEVVIENSYYLTMFRNRMGQKVSLDSLQTFDTLQDDGVTPYPPLTPYAALGKSMTLQPMMIRQLCYATVDTPIIGSQVFGIDNRGQTGSPGNGLQPNPGVNPGNNVMFFDVSTIGGPYPGSPDHNEFNLQLDQNSGGVVVPGACAAINPFCNVSAQEIATFPGPVGEVYNKVKASPYEPGYHALQSAVPIFTFQPDTSYENNSIKIDIELSWAMFGGSPDGQAFSVLDVEFQLMKGQTFADAFNNWQIRPNANGKRGGYNGGSTYSTISGCMIDNKAIRGIEIGNGVYHGTPSMYSFNDQYSYHGSVWFNPGDQLYLICNIMSRGNTGGRDLQFVFFSDTYEFRNSYQSGANSYTPSNTSLPYTLSSTVNSASSNAGYTIGPIFTPTGQTFAQYFDFGVAGASWTPTPVTQPQSYIRLTFNSQFKSTPARVYMVNEALSRMAEIITNDNFRVYSDYFGRTDAEPYTSILDGEAGLTAITNGILIRGYTPLLAYMMGYSSFRQTTLSGTATTHTLNLSDEPIISGTSNIVVVTNPTGTTIVLPDRTIAYPVGFQLIVEQGTGMATIQGDTGVTVYAPAGIYSTNGIGSQILLTKVGENIWLLASRSSMFCSFKELIDALNCVHTSGFAIEDDPSRSGYQRVRVEPIAHFYDSSSVMLTCENVNAVETSANSGECISEIEIGYAKWEAEQAQGLDEFLTKRIYRTTLNTIRAKWQKLCSFVASGYAIETTRRRLGTNTTDWRYDKDNFMISAIRSDGGFTSENGGFTTTPAPSSLIDPATVYNARISPVRNLLRWLRWILPSYANPSTGKLIFTQGEGNYYASGKLITNPIEADALHENQTLKLSDYTAIIPMIYKNDLVTFKYPLSFNQWLSIDNNKYYWSHYLHILPQIDM